MAWDTEVVKVELFKKWPNFTANWRDNLGPSGRQFLTGKQLQGNHVSSDLQG